MPNEPSVQYEWALEQHRARKYAEAADLYQKYIAAHPNFAPVYGLRAECLLRQGKTAEAIARWNQSEQASEGTPEDAESLICEVNGGPSPDQRRCELLAKAQTGDIESAICADRS